MQNVIVIVGRMSWQVSIMLVLVFVVRKLFENMHVSKKFMMLLWAMPFFLLIVPWRISLPNGFWRAAPTEMSVKGMTPEETPAASARTVNTEEREECWADTDKGLSDKMYVSGSNRNRDSQTNTVEGAGQNQSSNIQASNQNQSANTNISSQKQKTDKDELPDRSSKNNQYIILQALTAIWLIGISALFTCNIIGYILLRRKLLCSIKIDEGIYMADGISAPMTAGMIKPRIYIPTGLQQEYEKYVLAHEKTHIRRFDTLYKTIVYSIVCLHWFNPLVWAAFYLFQKDMEMACDEETVRFLGMEEQRAYAQALLEVANGGIVKNRIMFVAPLTFEGGNVKDRIKNIMKYKKKAAHMAVSILTLCGVVAIIFMTKDSSGQEITKSQRKDAVEFGQAEARLMLKEEARKRYREFILRVERAIMDDFQSVSTEDLHICDVFNYGVRTNGYSLGHYMADLDGDGIEELMFGKNEQNSINNCAYDIYTIQDGEVVRVTDGKSYGGFYLCEDGTILNILEEGNGTSYVYYQYQGGRLDLIESVFYKQDSRMRYWFYNDKEVSVESAEYIDDAEVAEIMEKYICTGMSFNSFNHPSGASEPTPTPTPMKVYEDNDHLTFADLSGMEFMFSGGAGGWRTIVTIYPDGTFEGQYTQGSTDTGYKTPKGTRYECEFSGQFTDLVKVAPYEYAMKFKYLKQKGTPGEERDVDGLKIVTVEPYGFEDADIFAVYLPGKKFEELPREYVHYTHGVAGDEVLTSYGLYNIGGEEGYIVWPEYDMSELLGTPTPSPSPFPIPTLTPEEIESMRGHRFQDRDDVSFADLEGLFFWSHRGGGMVDLQINSDGTFRGEFHEGTNECFYSGRFSSMEKIAPYEYKLKCEYVKVDGTPGEQRIVDGVKVTTTQPYGCDNADEFILYLPGKRIAEMPDAYWEWYAPPYWYDGIEKNYMLYNVGGGEFFGIPAG